MKSTVLFLIAAAADAQLVTPTTIPRGPNPPVVFVNGYQIDCNGSKFANTFGIFDQILQSQNRATLFFDNCVYPNKPSLEELGNNFGTYLGSLKYSDGTLVPQVDVVAHSMGGLIVRSYLAGKQLDGTYRPPTLDTFGTVRPNLVGGTTAFSIRKLVFLATPHFGTSIPLGFSGDKQLDELRSGSLFTFDLATWNQGTDDLRGIDALALAGNAGTGAATIPRFDDGVVSLTSASIGFARLGRTRILPVCHTGPGLITVAGLCPANIPGIADASSANSVSARIVTSFLADTADWTILGQPAQENEYLFAGGGLTLRAKSPDDKFLSIDKATANKDLNVNNNAVAYTEYIFPRPQTVTVTSGATTVKSTFDVNPGYVNARILKDGPYIARVLPSAAAVSPLVVGANSYISIYGANLDGARVSSNGNPLTVIASRPNQINAVLDLAPTAVPSNAVSTMVPLTVTTATGQNTVQFLTEPNVPAVFTQDSSGSGSASALNAITNGLVTASSPLKAGDYVSLYLTGITFISHFDSQVTVTVGGQNCPVQYAGIAPGYTVLDQINCQIPTGITPGNAPVIVTAGGRASNTATLAIQ
ncbi:MAG: IPT/TIG domain-containing protein [Acidobacteriota bacterium]|nr:IPT/TIG domain-containing protein [Acidobacteriota bacterium]